MESVHGVDVSWLHNPNKEHHHRSHAPTTPGLTRDVRPATSSHGGHPAPASASSDDISEQPKSTQSSVPPATPSGTDSVPSRPPTASPGVDTPQPRSVAKRPTLGNREITDPKSGTGSGKSSRRNSWINNISSKFSSTQVQGQQPPPSPTPPQTSRPQVNGANAGAATQTAREQATQASGQAGRREVEEMLPYVPAKPKDSPGSFFSTLSRRLSSGAQGGAARPAELGGVCPRRILNVDRSRERCLVPELGPCKLRRVSFLVDVEIAGGPRYSSTDDTPGEAQKKTKKTKDRAEGEALKHPDAITELKQDGTSANAADKADKVADEAKSDPDEALSADGAVDLPPKDPSVKREKKKRSEEERKERKEKKRRTAEANGFAPVELVRDGDGSSPPSAATTPPASGTVTPKSQDRPTTDPVRIYRRCCQLRESPILKRITEQLMSPTCTMPSEPGVVTSLNLTGSRLQLADFVTLGDWLAIVPVKNLRLEDADLADEAVRVVLAGLLAAKRPEPIKRRLGSSSKSLTHRGKRSGVVEKITLKHNPRITKTGWKHIAQFINMCRSVKAVDVSMNKFPATIPPSAYNTPVKGVGRTSPTKNGQPIDAAEMFKKALSDRLGGARMEELVMAECDLNANQIRSILDGATISGISRFGLAGNNLDDEGLEHVLSYVRSGVCKIIDLGGNDLHGKLGKLADALMYNPDCPVWGLSLAYCNLDTESLKSLLPALTQLPDFRFIDLSHNKRMFAADGGATRLLRKYIPLLANLKRLHLVDVGLTAKQVIALAEILPEGPALAHLNILENSELTAIATSTDDNSQEEAAAVYAALMVAVRVSKCIICIDVDVPSPEMSEIVKALARQVVAYCLRNLQNLALPGLPAHAGKDPQELALPNVLSHLDGSRDTRDSDNPAPDEGHLLVSGAGVVKALQSLLGEDARRSSAVISGQATPTDREGEDGREKDRKGQAKEMSKALLDDARKIRARLQPTLAKAATADDDMAYRRVVFLDETLRGMIQRFEDEYPETRIATPLPPAYSPASSTDSTFAPRQNQQVAGMFASFTSDAFSNDTDGDDEPHSPPVTSRRVSDAYLASRALSLEEGHIHRAGQKARRDLVDLPSPTPGSTPANGVGPAHTASEQRLAALSKKIEGIDGLELRDIIRSGGWDEVMTRLGSNFEELRVLQDQDPEGWDRLRESQIKAMANSGCTDAVGATAAAVAVE